MENVAARHSSSASMSRGSSPRCMARHVDRGPGRLQRFSEHRPKERSRILGTFREPAGSAANRLAGVYTLNSVRVAVRSPQLRIQNRAIGQGVAVDLARHGIRIWPASASAYASCNLA